MSTGILKRKIGIEGQIDEFLDLVSESGLIFKSAVASYLKKRYGCFS